MSKRTVIILLIVVLLLCALVSVCSLGGISLYRKLTGTQTTPTPESTAAPGSNATIMPETRASGGHLTLYGSLPPTLDPALVQDSTSAEYVVHLFSGLVSLNADAKIVPDLATHWDVTSEGTVYVFHLDPDAEFSNGRPITAEDVAFSIERALSPALSSPAASSYLDDIKGALAYASGEADHIEGLEVVDDQTLRITIDAPKAYFLAKLTYPTSYVVDRNQVAKGASWMLSPVCSGPFVLREMDRDHLVLARNAHYVGRPVLLDTVTYVFAGGDPMTMYETGELDIVSVTPYGVERVLDPHNPLHSQLHTATEASVRYLGFNTNVPPFDDPAVRQAFAMAIDKERLADLVFRGTAVAAHGILPPALPDHDPSFEGIPYDPEQARAKLATSRYAGHMPELVLSTAGTSAHLGSDARAVLAMLEENLGLEIVVEQLEWSDFLKDLNRGRFQMALSGWIADYPDSQNFLDLLFHSASLQNRSGYANAEVDALLESARVELDPERRTELYRQAESIIVHDAPWIPLTHAISHTLVKPHIRGYSSSSTMYPWLCDIYLA
ncbi:MAG: peptide ABC transporter substrate-binding protein, partial [Anaerolineae bacterium]|nr:peptide ABC transporter substrate-binding protein [Anaerolineae bacterium]